MKSRICAKSLSHALVLILVLCAFQHVVAQAHEPKAGDLSKLKVEKFDWFAASELPDGGIRKRYPFSIPESKTDDSPPAAAPDKTQIEKFIYRISIRNTGNKEISYLKWVYEFSDPNNGKPLAGYEFESEVLIKPGKGKRSMRKNPHLRPRQSTLSCCGLIKKIPTEKMRSLHHSAIGNKIWPAKTVSS